MYKPCGDCVYFNLIDPAHMKGCCRIYGINRFAETPSCGCAAYESPNTQEVQDNGRNRHNNITV